MAGVLVFDIETVPDEELIAASPSARPDREADALPKIPFNRVVVIGAAVLDVERGAALESYRLESLHMLRGREPELLADFWKLAEGLRLVSFNGRHFDLPVLEARSLRHGLALPWYFADGSVRDDPALHLDLLQFLSNGEPRNRAKLHDYCKLIGLPGKMGIDGSQVAELVKSGRLEELSAYCATDVLQTLGLFLRVQRLRGACRPSTYSEMLRGIQQSIVQFLGARSGLERERLETFLELSDSFWNHHVASAAPEGLQNVGRPEARDPEDAQLWVDTQRGRKDRPVEHKEVLELVVA
jgi:3'-5' exonuclease